MSSLEIVASTWMTHAARLTWIFTLAVMLVLVLRRVLRRSCGAEAVPLLWWLVPLALAAVQAPHPAVRVDALPPVVVRIAGGSRWVPPAPAPGWAIPWPLLAMAAWLLGAIAVLVLIGMAQRRYLRRLAGARAIDIAGANRPVWQAVQNDLGPAVVGALGVRIVLPADFRVRYTPFEQALILAHEQAHARRRDGLWRLLAQALAALFWFHPLAWLALACLRQDQELACDAAVLREHGAPRRDYANAMLKTQASPLMLPVGCSWSARHPLTERVAMLKLPVPTTTRRLAGHAALGAIVLAGSFAVYAAQSAPAVHHPSAAAVKEALVLFDGARTAVTDYWFHHGYELPANNATAQLPEGSLIVGKDVDGVTFADGRLTATLRDSAGGGHVRLVAMPDAEHQTMRWQCESPDIPEIARLHEGCAYVPAGASDDGSGRATFTLELAVGVAGQPAHLHSTTCLKGADDAYHFVVTTDKALPPWKGKVGIVPAPDGQMEIHARITGGSLKAPVTPILRTRVGPSAVIQIGRVVAGVDHTLRLDLTAWPGCGTPRPVVDDGDVHARFSGPSARVMASTLAERAGLTLLDPGSLDDSRPVAGNFEGVPPRRALQLIGSLVGMKPEFSGQTVRFVAR
ncbi:MAG: pilin [Xanthomonadaceae bacterium]|nr:pilin [Xanthomonadaceae bacterium]